MYQKAIEDAQKALIYAVENNAQEGLIDAINELIDAKVAAAIKDLDDKINKRGQYDRDY